LWLSIIRQIGSTSLHQGGHHYLSCSAAAGAGAAAAAVEPDLAGGGFGWVFAEYVSPPAFKKLIPFDAELPPLPLFIVDAVWEQTHEKKAKRSFL
jgi:hypothetical protein